MKFSASIQHIEGRIHALGDFQARAEHLLATKRNVSSASLIGLAAALRAEWRECLGAKRAGKKIMVEED